MPNAARPLLASLLVLVGFSTQVRADAQAPDASSSDAGAAEAPAFDGTYRYAGNDAEARAINAAIDRSVSDVNFVIRGATRRYLRRKSVPPETIVFNPHGQQLELLWGETKRWQGLPDGRSRLNRRANKPDRWISVRIQGRRLTQVVREDGSRRTTSFILSEDGQRMTVNVRVQSSRLGEDLRLRLSFVRAD